MKRKVRATIKHAPTLTEEERSRELVEHIKNIPPHMLDKIPAGAALKPSAQTLHRMMMQQFAPMYNPMPYYSQQQQQATNMKHDNDIKEQAVNQAKQDIIVEQERRRKIAQQDATNKREVAREEHNIKMQKQELDHAVKVQEQKQHLERQHQELNYRRELLDKDNEISRLNMQKDEMEAFNRQLEHQIELKRKQSNIEELKHKYTAVEQQHTELQNEHDALIETINSYNSSPVKRKYKDLIINNAKLESENMMLKEVNDKRQQAFIMSMKNKAFNDINYQTSMNDLTAQLKQAEADLALQIEANEQIKRKVKRKEYLYGKIEDIWQQQQDKELESKQLEEQERQSNIELPTEAAINVAKKTLENQQKQTQINTNIDLQRKIVESKVAESQLDYLNSQESIANMKLIAKIETAIENEKNKANELKKTATLFHNAAQQKLVNDMNKDLNNLVISGSDPAPVLWESISADMSPQEQNVRIQAAADEYAKANQVNDIYRRAQENLRNLIATNTPSSQRIRDWLAEHDVNLDSVNSTSMTELIRDVKATINVDLLNY